MGKQEEEKALRYALALLRVGLVPKQYLVEQVDKAIDDDLRRQADELRKRR